MHQDQGCAQRVAFFGGSFDPPHLGHLAVARAARDALRLDTVLFAPVGSQPLKPLGSSAPFDERVAMTRLAIAGDPGFEISLADAPDPQGKPNYTLETLRDLKSHLPAGSCLFCLMGADSFLGLRRWHGGAEIPFAASLVVASRPGQRLDSLAACLPEGITLEAELPPDSPSSSAVPAIELRAFRLRNTAGATALFYLLPNLDVEISASDIRSQVRTLSDSPASARAFLPQPVADYILTHSLYR